MYSPAPFLSSLYGRRSVRRYTSQAVPRELITRLLDAACQAASAHNRQPWRFVVVMRGPLRETLAEHMGERFAQDLMRDGIPAAQAQTQVERSRQRIGGAPCLIVACLTLEEMDCYPDAARRTLETQMGVQSVAAATQNLLLAAQAEGLGACWMCAPLFCSDVVLDVLDLPRHWLPQAFITLGYPAESAKPKSLAPVDSRILYRE